MNNLKLVYTCPDTGYSVHQEDCFITDCNDVTINQYDWILLDPNNNHIASAFKPKVLTGPAGWLKQVAKTRLNVQKKILDRLNVELKVAQDAHDKWASVYDKIK